MSGPQVNLSRLVGLVIIGAACLFVADKIIETRIWRLAEADGTALALVVAAGATAYALSAFLLSAAWLKLLRWSGQEDAPTKQCLGLYARSQIAKYVPGNVFHIVGRHVMGRNLGFGHTAMLWAALLETVGLILAASVLALLGALVWLAPGGGPSPVTLAAIGAILLLVPFALAYGLPRLASARGLAGRVGDARDVVTGLIPAYLLHVLFFLLCGGILWGVAGTLGEPSLALLPPVVAAVATAWIAGFLTPGAAAGIGVREAVLIGALSGIIGEPESTLMAIAFRGITLSGDLLFFALSYPLASLARRPQP
ncbi:MAG: hypothetical protein ACE5KF_09580 [Kiloniellaceae bacterium]